MRDGDLFETALRAIRAADPIDYTVIPMEQKDRRYVSVFLRDGSRQTLIDNLQACLEGEKDWRITLVPIEATIPKLQENEGRKTEKKTQRKLALREEIYHEVSANAKLDRDFLIFVILSTIVAAVGLHSNSVAGVIGAMVIAPLLGPILGFSLGAVMVAAALLPPGAAVGLFLGIGEWALASRAALLLALNVASLVLSALAVFRLRGIRPRLWLERKDADRAVAINIALSILLLLIAVVLIVLLDLGAKVSIG